MSKQGIENGKISINSLDVKNGSLGIGTNTPKRLLHIHNPGVAQSSINLTNASTGIGEGDNGLRIVVDENGKSYIINGENQNFIIGTNNLSQLILKNNGYVGIGVIDPQALLDVNGGIRAGYDSDVSSILGRAVIGYSGQSDIATFSHLDRNNSTDYAFAQNSIGETIINAALGKNINFKINNSNVGIITSDGKMAIGATTTSSNLLLNSTQNVELTLKRDVYLANQNYGTIIFKSSTEDISAIKSGYDNNWFRTLTFQVHNGGSGLEDKLFLSRNYVNIYGAALQVSVDTDKASYLGRSAIGYNGTHSDVATFAHLDKNNGTSYALGHTASGGTILNAATGQNIDFRINNIDVLKLLSGGDIYIINKIGIGISNPSRKVHIFTNDSNTSTGQLYVEQSGTGNCWLTLGKTGSHHYSLGIDSSDNTFCIGYDSSSPNGGVQTNPRITIKSNGEVGIGEKNPGAKLSISGNNTGGGNDLLMLSTGGITGDNNKYLIDLRQDISALSITSRNDDNSFYKSLLTLKHSGLVGIGVIDPSLANLQIAGNVALQTDYPEIDFYRGDNRLGYVGANDDSGQEGVYIVAVNSRKIQFNTAGLERMRISSIGNVGIGTNNPQALFHVSGPGNNNIRIGTSDNTGSAAIAFYPNNVAKYVIGVPAGSSDLHFSVGGYLDNSKMVLDSDGKVGLGIVSPQSVIHIKKDSGRIILQKDTTESTGALTFSIRDNNGSERVDLGWTPIATQLVNDSLANDVVIRSMGGNLRLVAGATSGVKPSNTAIFVSTNGNVAVGTSTTSAKFHVEGDAIFSNVVGSERIMIRGTGTGGRTWQLGCVGGGTLGNFNITDRSVEQIRLAIDGSGNIGIGIVNPQYPLHVNGSQIRLWNQVDNGDAIIAVRAGSSGKSKLILQPANNSALAMGIYSQNSVQRLDVVDEAENPRVSFLPDGKVGIGNTNPQLKLEVSGKVKATNFVVNSTDTDTFTAQLGNNTSTIHQYGMSQMAGINTANQNLGLGISGYEGIGFFTNGNQKPRLQIGADGNIGVWTTSPLVPLQVACSSGGYALQLTTTDFVNSSSGSRLLFDFGAATGNTVVGIRANTAGGVSLGNLCLQYSGGNVGIGTTNPLSRLDVNGGLRVQSTTIPTSGVGVEIAYSGAEGVVIAYDRSTSAYKPLWLNNLLVVTSASGSVGVGTASIPSTMKLAVSGGGLGMMGGQGIGLYDSNNADYCAIVNSGSSQATQRMSFFTNGEVMSILRNGNVGIGISDPVTKLHLSNSVSGGAVAFTVTNTNTNSGSSSALWFSRVSSVTGLNNYMGISYDTYNGKELNVVLSNDTDSVFNIKNWSGIVRAYINASGVFYNVGNVYSLGAAYFGYGNASGVSGLLQVNNSNTQYMQYFTSGNLSTYNPENVGSNVEVRLGAAWGRSGVYVANANLNILTSNDIIFGAGGNTEQMIIKAGTGRIGMGTTSPSNILHIKKDQNSGTYCIIENANSGNDANLSAFVLRSQADFTKYGSLNQFNNGYNTDGLCVANSIGLLSYGNSNGLRIFTYDAYSLILGTNNTARLTLDNIGNVKIGTVGAGTPTTSPTYLTMDNTYHSTTDWTKLKLYLYKHDSNGEYHGIGVGNNYNMYYSAGNASFGMHQFFAAGSEKMRITAGGCVAIGNFSSVTPTNELHLYKASGGVAITLQNASRRYDIWNDGTKLYITDGNVTLNSFDASGNIMAKGIVHYTSYVMPSNGNWVKVATAAGGHGKFRYIMRHLTSNSPNMATGEIIIINSNSARMKHFTGGYNQNYQIEWRGLDFGSYYEIWAKVDNGISANLIIIEPYGQITIHDGSNTDSDLSNNGQNRTDTYDKLPDYAEIHHGINFVTYNYMGLGKNPSYMFDLATNRNDWAASINNSNADGCGLMVSLNHNSSTLYSYLAYGPNSNIVFKVSGTGQIHSDAGTSISSPADFAEWTKVTGDINEYEIGTVVQQSHEDLAVMPATDSESIYGIVTDRATFCGGLTEAFENKEIKKDFMKLQINELESKYNAKRVAMTGHVQCKVVGVIRKGQKLTISNIRGVARAVETFEEKALAFAIARQDYNSEKVGLIEVRVL